MNAVVDAGSPVLACIGLVVLCLFPAGVLSGALWWASVREDKARAAREMKPPQIVMIDARHQEGLYKCRDLLRAGWTPLLGNSLGVIFLKKDS